MINKENLINYDKYTFVDIITGILYDKQTFEIVGCL